MSIVSITYQERKVQRKGTRHRWVEVRNNKAAFALYNIQALAEEAWKDEAGAGAAVALNEFDTYDGSRKQPRHLRRRRSRRLLIC